MSVVIKVYFGTMIKVEVQNSSNEVYDQVKEVIISKYNIDGEDNCLNYINIWD